MGNQSYSVFSLDLEKKIAEVIFKIITATADEAKTNGTKRYFKKKSFCEEMAISNNTLSLWITKGLKVIQIEGIMMIDMIDAIEFLNKHKI